MDESGIQQRIAEQLQVFDLELLAAIHRYEIDVPGLARREIAARGVSADGKWVGFDQARELLRLS